MSALFFKLSKIFSAAAITLFSAFLVVMPALGCECRQQTVAKYSNYRKLIQELDVAVFTGKVIKQVKPPSSQKTIAVTLKVYESWKNAETAELTVYAKPDADACGYDFVTGRSYFVVAYRVDNQYHTDACTPTNELKRSAKHLSELNRITQGKKIAVNNRRLNIAERRTIRV
jgi:hypothetical protein